MAKRIDLTGQKFGRWSVIKPTRSNKQGYYYLCECECGNKKEVKGTSLKSGVSISCGCLQKEIAAETIPLKRNVLELQRYEDCLVPLFRRRKSEGKTSKYKGVSYSKNCNKYRAYIQIRRKLIGLGFYETEQEAYKARKIAEKLIYEPFLVREKKLHFLCKTVGFDVKEAEIFLADDSYLNKQIQKALEYIKAS